MFFTANKGDLVKACDYLTKVYDKKSTMPILENVLCVVEAGEMVLSATDLDNVGRYIVVAEYDNYQSGKITFPLADFQKAVKLLEDGALVEFSMEGENLSIKSGKTQFTLKTLPSDDFPLLKPGAGDACNAIIGNECFTESIDKTKICISTEEYRYYLNGILFESVDDSILLVATDGKQLSFQKLAVLEMDSKIPENCIVHKKSIDALIHIAKKSKNQISATFYADGKCKFKAGCYELESKLIDATYPDYRRVIPSLNETKTTIRIQSDEFQKSIKRVAAFGAKDCAMALMVNGESYVRVSGENGVAREDLDLFYEGLSLETGLNPKYILNALGKIDGTVDILSSDKVSAIRVHSHGERDSGYVIVPMRV